MNCQEFRKAWLEHTDSNLSSHIEICEECIIWIETQMTSDEEVQFLKEVPMPQVNLEERIMQAIYQSAGQGMPPQAAAIQPPVPITASKKRPKSFPSFAWVSAAAVLLAVGFAGYHQLTGSGQVETASNTKATESAANQSPAIAYSNSTGETAPKAASPDAPVQAQRQLIQTAPAAESNQALASKKAASPSQTSPAPPSGGEAAMAGKQKAAATAPEAANRPERPLIAARNASEKPLTDAVPKADATAHADAGNEANHSAKLPLSPKSEPAGDQSGYTLAAIPEPESKAKMGSSKALVGPPAPGSVTKPITLSSFSDADTAVQASDMPVPVLAQLPPGFSLGEISVQYESETSQKVTRLWADYKRDKDWIKVEVTRNEHGERSLSIPGTFTATQLFTVNGEQAIAVSFDQQGAKDTSAQHAVHFNAQAGNQSLYVVLTAHGIRLDELMEASKQLTWKH